MPIWGVDIHPRYQAGINIEQIRREGFDFLAVKVSEATNGTFMSAGSADFLRRGKACGLLCLGYHYLRAGNEDAQARLFAEQLRIAEVPGMLDAEDGAGDITNIRRFIEACRRHGAHVPLMYLPRWYWQRIGSPDLRDLPPLWASRYVTGDAGPASVMYTRHNPAGWEPYGGQPVEVLQFTDKARVAGRNIDANHYRGTRDQFAALLGGLPPEDTMPSPAEIWNHPVRNFLGGFPEASLILSATEGRVAALQAEVAGLRESVAQLAAAHTNELDPNDLIDRFAEAAKAALAEAVVDVEVTVNGPTRTPTA